jgi:hypothetical protein
VRELLDVNNSYGKKESNTYVDTFAIPHHFTGQLRRHLSQPQDTVYTALFTLPVNISHKGATGLKRYDLG